MRKDKLVIHECYAGKRKSEEVFAALFYLRCHWQPHQLLQWHSLDDELDERQKSGNSFEIRYQPELCL